MEGVPGWLQQLAAVRPFLLAAGPAVVLSALLRLASMAPSKPTHSTRCRSSGSIHT